MLGSVGLVVLTLFLASGMQSELMTADDNGTISVTITTRPGLLDEKANDILNQVESIVSSHENVDSTCSAITAAAVRSALLKR